MRRHRPTATEAPWQPTAAQLAAAVDLRLPDLLAAGLDVVFCGINPGLYSAAVGHHFARPGNRFWPTLHRAGFTSRLVSPFEDHTLQATNLPLRVGFTNIAPRTTATADELTPAELRAGAGALRRKLERVSPRVLAVLGITAYRAAFAAPNATIGLQPARIGATEVWLLPNPSGLNAHHPPRILTAMFRELRRHLAR